MVVSVEQISDEGEDGDEPQAEIAGESPPA